MYYVQHRLAAKKAKEQLEACRNNFRAARLAGADDAKLDTLLAAVERAYLAQQRLRATKLSELV